MDVFDPHDSTVRQAHLRSHPLVTNEFTAFTPSIPKVVGLVLDAVMLHKKSICFNALPQMGKTKILHCCVAAIAQQSEYSDRLVLVVTVDPNSHENIIRNLIRSVNLDMPKYFSIDRAREDLLATIDGRLRLIDGRHFILFIDEMHALTNNDFECLQFLQNELALRNMSMTVIGFAQTQIEKCLSSLRVKGRPELIVRFLNEVVGLPSCDSEDWVRRSLATYDDTLIYPIGSNCTYTRFFLPLAFDAGFRLVNYSHEIFSALDEAASSNKLPCIPTVCAFEMFRLILIRSRDFDSPDFTLDSQIIAKAIVECQIAGYSTNLKLASAGR